MTGYRLIRNGEAFYDGDDMPDWQYPPDAIVANPDDPRVFLPVAPEDIPEGVIAPEEAENPPLVYAEVLPLIWGRQAIPTD